MRKVFRLFGKKEKQQSILDKYAEATDAVQEGNGKRCGNVLITHEEAVKHGFITNKLNKFGTPNHWYVADKSYNEVRTCWMRKCNACGNEESIESPVGNFSFNIKNQNDASKIYIEVTCTRCGFKCEEPIKSKWPVDEMQITKNNYDVVVAEIVKKRNEEVKLQETKELKRSLLIVSGFITAIITAITIILLLKS